jgi:hypothetical protein
MEIGREEEELKDIQETNQSPRGFVITFIWNLISLVWFVYGALSENILDYELHSRTASLMYTINGTNVTAAIPSSSFVNGTYIFRIHVMVDSVYRTRMATVCNCVSLSLYRHFLCRVLVVAQSGIWHSS